MPQKNEAAGRATGAEGPPPGAAHGGNLHEDLSRGGDVVGASDRAFGLTVAAVGTAIGGVRLVFARPFAWWWLGVAFVALLLALFWTPPLAPLNRLWLRLGSVLYKLVNPIVMALLFFSTIVPIGGVMRLCGRDPLRLRRDPATASYWIPRQPADPPAEAMRRQF